MADRNFVYNEDDFCDDENHDYYEYEYDYDEDETYDYNKSSSGCDACGGSNESGCLYFDPSECKYSR